MYFTRQLGKVCHVLDGKTGRAPAPCGARLGRVALLRLRAGEPSRFIMTEKPLDTPLCKHCQKSLAQMGKVSFKEEISLAPMVA